MALEGIYDAEELTVTKTSGGSGENVVWELCTHAVLWTTISETLHVPARTAWPYGYKTISRRLQCTKKSVEQSVSSVAEKKRQEVLCGEKRATFQLADTQNVHLQGFMFGFYRMFTS